MGSRSKSRGGGRGLRGWSDSDGDDGRYQLKETKVLPSASSFRQVTKAVSTGVSKGAAGQAIFLQSHEKERERKQKESAKDRRKEEEARSARPKENGNSRRDRDGDKDKDRDRDREKEKD